MKVIQSLIYQYYLPKLAWPLAKYYWKMLLQNLVLINYSSGEISEELSDPINQVLVGEKTYWTYPNFYKK